MDKITVAIEPKAPLPPAFEQLAQVLAAIDMRLRTPAAQAERAAIKTHLQAQAKARRRTRRKAA
jgi:hypothetical protein